MTDQPHGPEPQCPEIDLQGADALLMYADSERNADLLWVTDFVAPDPFHYLCDGKRSWVLVKDLELDRARSQSKCEVIALNRYESDPQHESTVNALHAVLWKFGFDRLLVPASFPLAIARELQQVGFQIEVAGDPLFVQRSIKTAAQIDAIAATQKAAEAAMATAQKVLTDARIRDDLLWLDGAPLTSQHVQRLIHHQLLDHDCSAHHTIVAGGQQAIDPHQAGHGPLPAHQPIIIDIFPRAAVSGYYGDITRTFVRGTVTEPVQRLYDTVAEAQSAAVAAIAANIDGARIHADVQRRFEAAGYQTGQIDGRMQGFFHGTGHGVGLEIHETPSLGHRQSLLAVGHTVTVEPGLYYAGVGGIRIEDLVVVEATGARNLTSYPKQLQL